jgi:uncharacterized delta-60 repeat protein
MTQPSVNDERLEAMLRERAGDGAPSDLHDTIRDAVALAPHRRPADRRVRGRTIQVLAVAAVIGVSATAAVLVGGGSTPEQQPLLAASADATPSPVVRPSNPPRPTPTRGALSTPGPSATPEPPVVDSYAGLPPMTIDRGGMGIAIEEDGGIVVARHDDRGLVIDRFDTTGHPDANSGQRRTIVADPWPSARTALAIAGDGTAVALNDDGDAGFELIRYRADGSVDAAFGDGGHVRSALGEQGPEPQYGTAAQNIALGPDGSIFVAGGSGAGTSADGSLEDSKDARFAIAKFSPDGRTVTSFGTRGQVFVDMREGVDLARAIAVQQDGGVMVVGETGRFMAGLDPYGVVRLTPDGAPVASALTQWCCGTHFSIAPMSDGRFVFVGLGGQGTPGSVVARHLQDGSLDPTFAHDGLLETPMHLVGLAVDAEGRIVVASIEGGLVRFLPNGGDDAEFDQLGGWPD